MKAATLRPLHYWGVHSLVDGCRNFSGIRVKGIGCNQRSVMIYPEQIKTNSVARVSYGWILYRSLMRNRKGSAI